MMSLDEFIDQWVEQYLLPDLRNIAGLPLEKTEVPFGGAGYPMLATTVAGMELLGLLLMPNESPVTSDSGHDTFINYWNHFLVPTRPVYRSLGDLIYKLVRHGIAHVFTAKHRVFVPKGQRLTIAIDRDANALLIDCLGFYRDFEASYMDEARPILRGDRSSTLVQWTTCGRCSRT